MAGYEYDAAGNLTRSQSMAGTWQRFEYDAAGRLINVKTDSNVLLANYTYGASNQRLSTTEGNLKTYYAWAGDATIAEYTEANSSGAVQWSKSHVYLGARLLATLQPNGNGGEFTQYHHPDRLGTRLITNAQDTSVQEQATLPFGTALDAESTGSTNRRFTSYDRSASTGLDYAVNRHYDSQQGRFIQVDPIGMGATSLENPQTLNLYAYCGNDPINHTDPSGLFWGKLFHAIGKITKVFNKIVKWALIALVVAVVVVAIVVSPEAAVQLLMGVAKFLVKIGIFKSSLMAYSIEGGTRIGVGIVGKILVGVEAVGAVSSYFQQDPDHRNDATNSNRSSSSQRETTNTVIDIDGSEVAVLSIAVVARPMLLGGAIGIGIGDIAIGTSILAAVGMFGVAVLVSQPMPPNAAVNANTSGRTRRIPRRPMRGDDCFKKYFNEIAWCVLAYGHDDRLLAKCETNALGNRTRCLNGLAPKPFDPTK
jgi:RHS repeat-associated protein